MILAVRRVLPGLARSRPIRSDPALVDQGLRHHDVCMMVTDMSAVMNRETIFTVPNILTADECEGLIRYTELRGFEDAPITTGYGFVMHPEVRNNTRVMYDNPTGASWLWERMAASVPQRLGPWRAVGLNERFRYYRYEPGQYFKWHGDGAFVRSDVERS